MLDHKKYPIIVGASYINDDKQIGILESAEIFEHKNDVEIVIDMCNKGQFYKLNYAMFCMYWRLL